jgi:DNA polymerase-3 subunit alpha
MVMLNEDEIVSIEEATEHEDCYDISMIANDFYINEPNFIANDIVVHNCGMDTTFIKRKNGEEAYELHPLLEPILGTTYGVMVFQEQVMQVLAAVGDIPLRDCYQVIKLISKKKTAGFAKYQDQFIKVGQEKLGVTKEYMENFFEQIKAFSGYGFNKSHAYAYSYLSARQIYLQTYYPLEFYTSAIRHQADYDKRKLYIIEAIKNGIKVEPLTINLSKETFDIVDDKIYI